jgi:hypothetical protein
MLVWLSGCGLFKPSSESEAIAEIPLALPIAPARRVVQQISAQWQGRQEIMLCVLELDQKHIAMAGLSSNGISLFNLSYDGKKLALDKSPLLPENISPKSIIKDLQLVYWPIAELQKILPPRWSLKSSLKHRYLYYDGNSWADVEYSQVDAIWAKSVVLTNHRYHYKLNIITVSYETVPE